MIQKSIINNRLVNVSLIVVIICVIVALANKFGVWAVVASSDATTTPAAPIHLPYIAKEYTPTNNGEDCYQWAGQIPLQTAVDDYVCVEMQPGIWATTVQIVMKSGHKLVGKDRDDVVLMAAAPWEGNGTNNQAEAVVHNNESIGAELSNFTIDANHLSTFGIGARDITVDSMKVINAKCDGIAIAGNNMMIQNSLIENNGNDCLNLGFAVENCPVDLRYEGKCYLPAAGIYVVNYEEEDDVREYAPIISGNTIRYNGGPGLDVDRVWGGIFTNNRVYKNRAWAGVSLYSASNWLLENNEIYHPATNSIMHPNHPICHGGPQGEHSAGVYLCQDKNLETKNNMVQNNQIAGYYGILSIGDDENGHMIVPHDNTFQNNNIGWSHVGCADDLDPASDIGGLNSWENNNCAGTADTPPLYFAAMCSDTVSRSTIQEWGIGETNSSTVTTAYVGWFNALRTEGGDFSSGDRIASGIVIATSFDESGTMWDEFPVMPIVHTQNYGLFEVTETYIAPNAGACLTIVP